MYFLPSLAVIAAVLPLAIPLLKMLQTDAFESQTTQRSEKELFEMSVERGVREAFQNVLDLGFQPFGTNCSQFKSKSGCDGEEEDVFLFHHVELPFMVTLSVLADGQKSVDFISGDLDGRVLVTTSLKEGGINMRDAQAWYQTLDAAEPQIVFEEHKRATEEWISQGFEPQLIETAQQFDQVILEQLNMPMCRQMIFSGAVFLGIGSLVFSLFFPLVIVGFVTAAFDLSWLIWEKIGKK